MAKADILRGQEIARGYKVCIVGATGAVGQAFIKCLEKRKFPVNDIKLLASERSVGKEMKFNGATHKVKALSAKEISGYDFALFSAGSTIANEFAPQAVAGGAIVIDNSSAFRMVDGVPLVVPEVNPDEIRKHKGIIANPNCSTIQMVVVLSPIHKKTKIKRVVVSTYQAVSGAGGRALTEFDEEAKSLTSGKKFTRNIFPRQIAFNVIPQIPQKDAFLASGYTVEETKMIDETKKIMGDPNIKVTATCVRVPVANAHSESVNIETEGKLFTKEVAEILSRAKGIKVFSKQDEFPTPAEISGSDEVFVGRIRQDNTIPNGINLWIVADNILKGAALNAVQIAEHIIANK